MQQSFSETINKIKNNKDLGLSSNIKKTIFWFLLSFAAVIASLELIVIIFNKLIGNPAFQDFGFTIKNGLTFFFIVFILCFLISVIKLLISKHSAKKAYEIKIIDPNNFNNEKEEGLYNIVKAASEKANLPKMPEVGIYDSEELNAFAVGANRKNALVAFSSSLIDLMTPDEIAAVACHEISHIANGDMVLLTMIEASVRALVYIIQIPLFLIQFAIRDDEKYAWLMRLLTIAFQFFVYKVSMFLGNLLLKFFSRKREFKADSLASKLLNKEAMISALKKLKENTQLDLPEPTEEQAALASFKIFSKSSVLDIFSTHPSIERRIANLEQLETNKNEK